MPKRRNTRRRRRRRRGGLGALAGPLSVLLAAVAIVAALTMFFKVAKIEVTGNSRYGAAEIIAASGVEQGDNLILLDRYHTSQRIYTELPYIVAARINPHFPDTLRIEVTETQATAAIQSGDAWWLLGASGEAMKVLEGVGSQEEAGDCLIITGLEAESPTVGEYLHLPEGGRLSAERLEELMSAMETEGMLEGMDSIDASDPDQLVLGYDGRFRVEIYYDADFGYKLECLREVVSALEPNERGTVRMTMKDDTEVRFIPAAE